MTGPSSERTAAADTIRHGLNGPLREMDSRAWKASLAALDALVAKSERQARSIEVLYRRSRKAEDERERERARADRAEAALERVRAVEWREEVDSNGEYTTERYRNASSVRAEIEDALSASSPPPVPTAALTEALSWALDVLEISLKRLDTIEEQPYSDEHLRLRDAGLAKARAALSAGSGGRETT